MTLDKTTLGVIVTLAVLIFSAGVAWAKLESRIATLEKLQEYSHGQFDLPAGAK